MLPFGQDADPGTVDHRLKPHLLKISNGFFNDPLKSKDIADINRRFL